MPVGQCRKNLSQAFDNVEKGDGMKVKTSCDTCLHNEVCGYKELMDEVTEKINNSGALTVHPFVNVELDCVKWKTSEYMRNAEINQMLKS